MKLRLLAIALATGLLALLAGSPSHAQEGAAGHKVFQVDSVHSSIVFKVIHAGLAPFYGTFGSVSGEIHYNEADITKSAVKVAVAAESVDSRHPGRDEHIKSDDFLAVATHPQLTFESTGIEKTGENDYKLSGNLTARGVTKPIVASLTMTGKGEGRGGEKIGAVARFSFKRSDFAINGPGIAEEIDIIVALEAVHRAQ